jgi:hypothetical protein
VHVCKKNPAGNWYFFFSSTADHVYTDCISTKALVTFNSHQSFGNLVKIGYLRKCHLTSFRGWPEVQNYSKGFPRRHHAGFLAASVGEMSIFFVSVLLRPRDTDSCTHQHFFLPRGETR